MTLARLSLAIFLLSVLAGVPAAGRASANPLEGTEWRLVEVGVHVKVHGPADPLCCPTKETVKRFAVREVRLEPAAGEEQSER